MIISTNYPTEKYLIQEMYPIVHRTIGRRDNAFNLISTGPLDIARVPVYSPNILANLWFDRLQHEIVDRIQSIRENELRPREDPKFIANGIEVITTTRYRRRRWLVSSSAPNSQLNNITLK